MKNIFHFRPAHKIRFIFMEDDDFSEDISTPEAQPQWTLEKEVYMREQLKQYTETTFRHMFSTMYLPRYAMEGKEEELRRRVQLNTDRFIQLFPNHVANETGDGYSEEAIAYIQKLEELSVATTPQEQNGGLSTLQSAISEGVADFAEGSILPLDETVLGPDFADIQTWMSQNKYVFKKGKEAGEAQVWKDEKRLTRIPRGIKKIYPIRSSEGAVIGIITVDGDGDVAARYESGGMEFNTLNKTKDEIEEGMVNPQGVRWGREYVNKLKKPLVKRVSDDVSRVIDDGKSDGSLPEEKLSQTDESLNPKAETTEEEKQTIHEFIRIHHEDLFELLRNMNDSFSPSWDQFKFNLSLVIRNGLLKSEADEKQKEEYSRMVDLLLRNEFRKDVDIKENEDAQGVFLDALNMKRLEFIQKQKEFQLIAGDDRQEAIKDFINEIHKAEQICEDLILILHRGLYLQLKNNEPLSEKSKSLLVSQWLTESDLSQQSDEENEEAFRDLEESYAYLKGELEKYKQKGDQKEINGCHQQMIELEYSLAIYSHFFKRIGGDLEESESDVSSSRDDQSVPSEEIPAGQFDDSREETIPHKPSDKLTEPTSKFVEEVESTEDIEKDYSSEKLQVPEGWEVGKIYYVSDYTLDMVMMGPGGTEFLYKEEKPENYIFQITVLEGGKARYEINPDISVNDLLSAYKQRGLNNVLTIEGEGSAFRMKRSGIFVPMQDRMVLQKPILELKWEGERTYFIEKNNLEKSALLFSAGTESVLSVFTTDDGKAGKLRLYEGGYMGYDYEGSDIKTQIESGSIASQKLDPRQFRIEGDPSTKKIVSITDGKAHFENDELVVTEPILITFEMKKEEQKGEYFEQLKKYIDDRVVVTGTADGSGVFDTRNVNKPGAGTDIDLRQFSYLGRWDYVADGEVLDRQGEKFRKIEQDYQRGNPSIYRMKDIQKNKIYLVASIGSPQMGLDYSRNGTVFVSIEDNGNLPEGIELILKARAIEELEKNIKKYQKTFAPIEEGSEKFEQVEEVKKALEEFKKQAQEMPGVFAFGQKEGIPPIENTRETEDNVAFTELESKKAEGAIAFRRPHRETFESAKGKIDSFWKRVSNSSTNIYGGIGNIKTENGVSSWEGQKMNFEMTLKVRVGINKGSCNLKGSVYVGENENGFLIEKPDVSDLPKRAQKELTSEKVEELFSEEYQKIFG